jgi:ATP-binding cassette subfamily B protein
VKEESRYRVVKQQRVSIARAIIKPTYLTFFDDCLSAVDTETEEAILNNLFEICKDKTTLIVSHRLCEECRYYYNSRGRKIIQQGSHNQLINEEGYYASLI